MYTFGLSLERAMHAMSVVYAMLQCDHGCRGNVLIPSLSRLPQAWVVDKDVHRQSKFVRTRTHAVLIFFICTAT